MSWSAATVSRMKSKLPACFCISSAFFETHDLVGAEAQRVVLLVARTS